MRQLRSSGSVKAISLNRDELLQRLYQIAEEALIAFPEIMEIRLFGSLARGEETGLSDVDIFILTNSGEKNPLERLRPYFDFFSRRLGMALDMIAATPEESDELEDLIRESLLLSKS